MESFSILIFGMICMSTNFRQRLLAQTFGYLLERRRRVQVSFIMCCEILCINDLGEQRVYGFLKTLQRILVQFCQQGSY